MTPAQAHDLARDIAARLEADIDAFAIVYHEDGDADIEFTRHAIEAITGLIQTAVNARVSA